jgi:predicted amidohydrolase YtcJ
MPSRQPNVVVVNANVRTMDDAGSVVEAVAVQDGIICAVGSTAEVRELAGPRTEVYDAGGRLLLPAFTDSHTHLRRAAFTMAYFIDFMTTTPRDLRDVLQQVSERAADSSAGTWIRGDNLFPEQLAEARMPTRYELDSVAPDHAVVLRGMGHHVITANSLALRIAGIGRDTPDPDGGRIERDEGGEPTGVLHERAKLRLDERRADSVVPPISTAERVSALRSSMAFLHAAGIASIHEIVREPEDMSDYLRLREEGGLAARVRFYIRGLEAETRLEHLVGAGFRSGFGDDWLRLGGVKFSIDGLETARNAAVYGGYADDPDNDGILRIDPEDLHEAIHKADAAGLQVAVHAIGPRAVDIALECFESLEPQPGQPRLVHRLEHAYMAATAVQWQRIANLGLLWSTQPSFMYDSGDVWTELLAKPADGNWLPLGSAQRLGVRTQINSDFPCSAINPLLGIATAVSRRTSTGQVIAADEAISVESAVGAMTGVPALDAYGSPGRQGAVQVGNMADLTVLSADIFAIPGEEIAETAVAMTMVDGRIVYRAD